MPRTGVPANFKGKAGRSGRKPKEYTLLKRRMIAESIDEAEKSFDFYVQVRDNPNEPTAMRKACADAILDRVLGKPKEMLSVDAKVKSSCDVESINQGIAAIVSAARAREADEVHSRSDSADPQ